MLFVHCLSCCGLVLVYVIVIINIIIFLLLLLLLLSTEAIKPVLVSED